MKRRYACWHGTEVTRKGILRRWYHVGSNTKCNDNEKKFELAAEFKTPESAVEWMKRTGRLQ